PTRRSSDLRYWANFIFSLADHCSETLKAEAEAKGIEIEQLIRAIIIPDWIRRNLGQGPPAKVSEQWRELSNLTFSSWRLPSNASNVRSRRSTGESALQPSPTVK